MIDWKPIWPPFRKIFLQYKVVCLLCFGNFNEYRKNKMIVISYEITLFFFYFRSAANNSIAPVRTLQTQNGIRLVPASQLRQVQVILCQINTIFRQLTQNMTTDCSMNYMFSSCYLASNCFYIHAEIPC